MTDYQTESFSLANPVGPDINNVPLLLRRLADELENRPPMCVHDLILHTDIEGQGYHHNITVYFTHDPADIEASQWAGDERP